MNSTASQSAPQAAAHTPAPPAGFVPVPLGSAFANLTGPWYARWVPHAAEPSSRPLGQIQFGFFVAPQHANLGNTCHGGMLCTFADIVLAAAARFQSDSAPSFLPTINLQTDFMAPAALGSWVQGQAQVLKMTTALVFTQGLITANGVVAVRASALLKRGPLLAPGSGWVDFDLPGLPPRR